LPPTNEERRDKRKRRLALLAEYAEILRAWGLNVSQNLNKLMHHGAKKEWTTTQFVQQLRRTRDYKQQFVGIKWQEGMTESQYNAEYMAFLREADDLGKKLSRQDYGSILRSGMDFEEFQARTTVLRDLRDNPELKRMFEKVLHARGMLGPQKNLSKKNMWDIMTGTGDPRWEAAWQEAAITFQLQRIGLKTSQKKKLGFTRKDLLELIESALRRRRLAEAVCERSQVSQRLTTDVRRKTSSLVRSETAPCGSQNAVRIPATTSFAPGTSVTV